MPVLIPRFRIIKGRNEERKVRNDRESSVKGKSTFASGKKVYCSLFVWRKGKQAVPFEMPGIVGSSTIGSSTGGGDEFTQLEREFNYATQTRHERAKWEDKNYTL